jgi:hypothetical protein
MPDPVAFNDPVPPVQLQIFNCGCSLQCFSNKGSVFNHEEVSSIRLSFEDMTEMERRFLLIGKSNSSNSNRHTCWFD